MTKEFKMTDFVRELTAANNSLTPEEHLDDCPVKHGASATCCWPISVCVPESFVALHANPPWMQEICQALGWQGGTWSDVVREVQRLASARDSELLAACKAVHKHLDHVGWPEDRTICEQLREAILKADPL